MSDIWWILTAGGRPSSSSVGSLLEAQRFILMPGASGLRTVAHLAERVLKSIRSAHRRLLRMLWRFFLTLYNGG